MVANVALGPVFRGVAKKEAMARARDWLKTVGLAGFENHYPHQLSGGMRKRVSLAAALINEPSILLMDEPFSALDVQTRAIMSNELLTLWDQSEPSVMFVTHDLEEAIALADKVVVMTAGPGTVKAVYDIDLPRPRGAVQEIRFEPRFLELHHQIWETLRDEVQRAYSRMSAAQNGRSGGMTAEAATSIAARRVRRRGRSDCRQCAAASPAPEAARPARPDRWPSSPWSAAGSSSATSRSSIRSSSARRWASSCAWPTGPSTAPPMVRSGCRSG